MGFLCTPPPPLHVLGTVTCPSAKSYNRHVVCRLRGKQLTDHGAVGPRLEKKTRPCLLMPLASAHAHATRNTVVTTHKLDHSAIRLDPRRRRRWLTFLVSTAVGRFVFCALLRAPFACRPVEGTGHASRQPHAQAPRLQTLEIRRGRQSSLRAPTPTR